MKIYDVSRLPSQIVIGHGGENDWLPIHFDCSALLENHPDGVITLWLTPNGAAEAYPVALEREGNVVTWTPKNSELTASTGRYQLRCQDGDAVGESDTKNYKVKESLAPGGDHPAETPSWAVQVVEDVAEAASHYPRIGDNGNWFVWDITAGEWVDTGVAAGGGGSGGADGFSPAVTITDITGGHRVTITDKDHPSGQTFDVMDGEEGAPGTPGTSPSVSVATITGGHRITITDAAHPQGQSIDVMDGSDYVLTQDDLQAIAGLVDLSGKADKIPRVAMASTDTTAEIEPNKLYVFPEMASLTITLAAITDATIVNEYHFIFTSGATATTTTFPAIPGLDDFAAEANMAYEVSILEGRALVTSWEVPA